MSGDLTEAEVRVWLVEEEKKAVWDGAVQLHDTSASRFLSLGLSLEESQYVP